MSEIFHTLNRGVDKRIIFLNDQDRFRFIHDLFEFNDEKWVNTTFYSFRAFSTSNDFVSRQIKKPRKMLVDILAFCLMPNHYHLLLKPRVENGITKFMRKLNIGYAKYFNEKYKRKGALFEGRYKSIVVKRNAHFIHLPYYIHCNPLDLVAPEWRNRRIKNYKKTVEFLESYRWSSHLDYLGKKNFPSVTKRDLLLEYFNGEKNYRNSLESWLKDFEAENLANLSLE